MSAISAMDNEGLDSNEELISQDADVELVTEASSTSDINNKNAGGNTSNKISAGSASEKYSEKSTSIDSPDVNMYYKNGTKFQATLKDNMGKGIANQDISFNLLTASGGKATYALTTNENGVASLPINLVVGTHTINVIFYGTANYNPCEGVGIVNVLATVISDDLVKYYKNETPFTATVVNNKGVPLANSHVSFTVKGKTYTMVSNDKGVATLPINLSPGTYTITTKNLVDGLFTTNTITVLSTLTTGDFTKGYLDSHQFTATVVNGSGSPSIGSQVSFTIKGKTYTMTTDSNGVATLPINLYPGTYSITTTNLNDGIKYTNTIRVLTNLGSYIVAPNVIINEQTNDKVTATLYDSLGYTIPNMKVTLTVNGKTYTATSDGNGIVTFTPNLSAGKYNATYKFSGTNTYKASTNTSTINIIGGKDVSFDVEQTLVKQGSTFNITVKDIDSNPIANLNLYFTINGINHNAVTNDKGVASIVVNENLGIVPISYTINQTGYVKKTGTSNVMVVSTLNPTLSTNTSSVFYNAGEYFYVKLSIDNMPLANQQITISINGKEYYVVTNDEGWASLLINLKPGQYDMVCKFNGTSDFEETSNTFPLKVLGVLDTNLNWVEEYEYVKGQSQFSVVLTDVNGNPLSNQNVVITVKSTKFTVSYTRVTNENGVASLPINLNVGSYFMSYKFEGNSKYGSSEGSTPITVITSLGTNIKYVGTGQYVTGEGQFAVVLTDANGKHLFNQTVVFTIKTPTDTVSYSKYTNEEGVASLPINLIPGKYDISYKFNGNAKYKNSSGSTPITVVDAASTGGFGYWLFGGDMNKVDLATLASKGTNNIFLNYYAFAANGEKKVLEWIEKANSYGIKVHIWMQVFFDGAFVSPLLANGTPNYEFFNEKINEAKYYASLSGVAGVHLDYLRFPGTAYKYANGVSAINTFVQMCSESVRATNPNIIVSAAIMPETSANTYYYGQDIKVLGKYLDVIIPMIYKGNYGAGSSWITTTTKWFVDNCNGGAQIWSGLQAYKSDSDTTILSISQLTTDANAAISGSASGVVLFRYGLSNTLDFNTLDSINGSSGGNDVPTGTVFTASEIKQGAKYLKEYMESKGALPTSITIGSKVCSVPQFLYLMALYTSQFGSQTQFTVIDVANPTNPSGDAVRQKLLKNDFVTTANELVKYMETNKKAPDYMDSAIGKMKYDTLVYSYAKVVNFLNSNSALPAFVYVTNVIDNHAITVVMYPSVSTSDYKYIKYCTTWLSYCPNCGYYGTLLDNPKGTYEGELTCSYCDCDYCGVTGKNKIASSNLYLTRLTESVPEGNVNPGTTVSLNDIIEAAKVVKGYYEANGNVPEEVTVGAGKVSGAQFLYLLSQAISNLGSSNTGDIKLIEVANPSGPFGDTISSTLNKEQYTELATRVANYIIANGQAPNYASSDLGKIIYDELVDSFSRILAYYGNNNKVMPSTVAINYGGGDGVSTSISELVKSLTSGLTTATAKATALYNYVRDKISYQFYYNTVKGAEGTLVSKSGNCCDQAQLLVAMGRSAGLTCRFVHGVCTFSSGSTYGHVWTQFQIDGKWITADPTSTRNSFGVINNWNTASYQLKGYYNVLPF